MFRSDYMPPPTSLTDRPRSRSRTVEAADSGQWYAVAHLLALGAVPSPRAIVSAARLAQVALLRAFLRCGGDPQATFGEVNALKVGRSMTACSEVVYARAIVRQCLKMFAIIPLEFSQMRDL